METLCYTGFQQAVEPFQPRLLTVPTDLETGMDVDAVEALLAGGRAPGVHLHRSGRATTRWR